jgi:hypothetical protein
MHRLSSEYEFIRSREYFEMKIIEMFLRQCLFDLKTTVTFKETASTNENSREIIKLVDFFVSKNSKISVEFATSILNYLEIITGTKKTYYYLY